MSVDITGLDRQELLRALWENSTPALFFVMTGGQGPTECTKGDETQRYVDYHCGRVIKAYAFDMTTQSLDPSRYDRDLGDGKMQRVVNELRAKKMTGLCHAASREKMTWLGHLNTE